MNLGGLLGRSNQNIYMTSQGQFIGQNQDQIQNVRLLTVLAIFFYRINVTKRADNNDYTPDESLPCSIAAQN